MMRKGGVIGGGAMPPPFHGPHQQQDTIYYHHGYPIVSIKFHYHYCLCYQGQVSAWQSATLLK